MKEPGYIDYRPVQNWITVCLSTKCWLYIVFFACVVIFLNSPSCVPSLKSGVYALTSRQSRERPIQTLMNQEHIIYLMSLRRNSIYPEHPVVQSLPALRTGKLGKIERLRGLVVEEGEVGRLVSLVVSACNIIEGTNVNCSEGRTQGFPIRWNE